MARILTSIVITALIFVGLSQFAQAQEIKKTTNPCAPDIAQYCKDLKPGDGRIAACLRQHENDLSQSCKDYMAGLREKGREFAKGCRTDLTKFCKHVKPGGGRVFQCLKQHEAELSDSCKAYFSKN